MKLTRWWLASIVIAACRTQPIEPRSGDLAMARNLATAIDFAMARDGATPCGSLSCDSATQVCVHYNWNESGYYECKALPPDCANVRTCACLATPYCGDNSLLVCKPLPAPNTLTCHCETCI